MRLFYIKTYGCSLNQADSEVMAGYLLASGKYRAGAVKDADVVIVNSCTVKNRSEASFMKDICMIGKPLVLAGCVPEADKERFADHTVIGTEALHMIVQACDSAISGESKRFISEGRAERLGIPKARRNPAVEIIPVSEGCLGNCTYCKVKQARGELDSYQPDAIKMQAISAVSSGAKEIWLTSQDMGCYGMDIGSSLPELIQDVSSVEGDFMIRVGMCNPNFALPLLPSLLEAFKSKKVFKYVHLPVQAGSDRVLQKMGRKYSKADFFTVVDAARSEFPDITIASDVICGFPGETDEEFQETMALVRQLQPDVLNISRFWPRPGTAAAMMEQLSG